MRYDPLFKILVFVLSILFILPAFAGPDRKDKVPVTTSSKKALEYFLKGRDLQESLQAQESIQYFEKAVAEDPHFALAYVYLALVTPTPQGFFETFDKAKENTGKVSEGEKLWINGFDAGVNAYAMKQRESYTKLVEMFPNDERAQNLLGNHYFGQQDYPKAIEYYHAALKINPNFSQPYNQLGYAQRFLENYSEAEKAFAKYIELIPDDPNPYDSFAELQMKIGKYDKSIEYYKKALDHNPNFVASHIGIATNLNFKNEHAAARKQLEKLFEISRNDGELRAAHFATVVSFADEGKMEEAVSELEKQLKIAQENNDAAAMAGDYVAMGNIYCELGQCEEAVKKYTQAVKVIKNSDLSEKVKNNFKRAYLFNLCRAAVRTNDLKTARKNADKHRKLVKEIENPFQFKLSHELMGMLELAEQDYEDAVEEFLQSNLQNPYNLYRLSVAYDGNKETEKAKEYYDRAVNFNGLNNLNYAFIRARLRK